MLKRSVGMIWVLPLVVGAASVLAEETRQLGAHEHGVGALNIAIDGNEVAMELRAPGADIVGFEHAAQSAEDRATVDAAVAVLARPLDLFILPAAAACSVTQASASLEGDLHDDDHATDEHVQDEHAEDDHADLAGADHQAEQADATHTEFHAEYLLTCAAPQAVTEISFAYFETFENARELEVQVLTGAGAKAFEVERGTPTLDLRGMF